MAEELESIWRNSIPTIDALNGSDEVITRDASASNGQQVKKNTYTVIYNWVKAQLDTAYGAFVTRWPSFAEVTAKPVSYPESIRTVNVSGAETTISMAEATTIVLYMGANTSLRLDDATLRAGRLKLIFIQDATGGRTLTLDSTLAGWFTPLGAGITLSTPANSIDIIEWYVDANLQRAYYLNDSRNLQEV